MKMEKKIHSCSYLGCNLTFDRPYRLKHHLLLHENPKPFTCKELGCTKSYTSKTHLQRHINSVHTKVDYNVSHRCPECMKEYRNKQNLKRHIRSHKKLLFCDICKMTFAKKNSLKAHIYRHTGVMAFGCNLCSKEFITNMDRRKHMKCHKTYICDLCNESFLHWSIYQKHLKSNHSFSEFICHDCGRKFKKRDYILRHMKTHSKCTALLQCPFEGCKRTYTEKKNLKQHYKMKHEKNTYNCVECDAKLSTKAKLNEHILKIHEQMSAKKEFVPKLLSDGRKERQDIGILKSSSALKLAGLVRVAESHG